MRDTLHKAIKPIKDRAGLWWITPLKWPSLLRECHSEITQLDSELSMVREQFREEQSRNEMLQRIANESRELASTATSKASAEKALSDNISYELGNAKTQLQKSSDTIGSLEHSIAKMEMESERLKAELAKTQAELERNGLELVKERHAHKETRIDNGLLQELVHRLNRLEIPTRRGIRAMLSKKLVAFALLLMPMCVCADFPPPFFYGVYTTNTAAWAQTNVISLSTTNATSKPLTNHYQDGVLTLFGLEAGANITLSHNGSNIVITGAAGGGDAGGTNARQFGTLTLTNLSGTGAVTNVVSLSTTNATSKPITNHFENGILTLYGLEAGANVSLSMNESNIVIASTGGGSEIFFNDNQFLPSATHTNIKSGALLTNVTFWQSNALLPALIATNQPGGTVDLFTFLTTNGAGIRGTSNGAVVVHGVIGSTTNSFEVRRSNNAAAIFGVTHSNTVRIVGPTQTGYGASLTIGSDVGSSQNNIELFTGNTLSGRWRSDSAGNQIISAEGGGELQFNYDGASSGRIAMGVPGIGNVWYMVPSASVAAWHGGTARRGQITNVWDIWGRTNLWLTRTGLLNGIVVTQDIRFLGHNSTSNHVWVCTNTATGEGEWRSYGLTQLSDVSDTMGVGIFNGDLLSFHEPMGLWTNSTPTVSQFAPATFPITIKSGAFLTNMNYFGTGTNNGDFYSQNHFPLADNTYSLGSASLAWLGAYVREDGISFMEIGGGADAVLISAPASIGSAYTLILPDAQGSNGQVITNNGTGALGWWTPVSSGGGITTNANQFGASVELTIKSGALLTNILFYPSNLTGPAIIATATTAQVTNLVELRGTNATVPISISSNANAVVYGRLDMSNAVAFRTNNIDFRLPVYQAFTNALQTNLVLQLTNTYEGVTHRIDAYGAGRLGNGRTNAWQLFCTVASGVTIYWPPGTTNGNFDVLVNSNQVVSFTFMGGLGSTNILAAYRVLEGIGAN